MGKGDREKSARERIKEQQAADRKREQRRRVITYTAAGVVAVAALGAGYLWNVNRSTAEQAGANLAPVAVAADAGVTMGNAGVEKPVIDIYEDFQCPACRELERVSGPTFKNLAAEGKAKVVYHPITIFDQEPTKGNSLRAGAAARCVTDGKQWVGFHDLLFKNQPSETVEGFKIDQLLAWGKEAGVTAPGFEQCVTQQKYAATQQTYTEKVDKAQNIMGTPTVKLNGKELDNNLLFSPSALREAVLNAAK
ncbi:DsbA family protein [Nonomuraea typhae]|uniref:DsbA family protein n=1 Tax=Nonomuraea typhae TaxID=2603600 RepID=UPI0012FCFBBA|nr:thioredoxin domain-containing protein [Nonomuraea typhae]